MPKNAMPKSVMQRSAAAADSETYRPELVENDEPRYLRRQKPVGIRRKKFGGKSATFYRNLFLWILAAAAGAVALYVTGDFLLHSPKVLFLKPGQGGGNSKPVGTPEAVL